MYYPNAQKYHCASRHENIPIHAFRYVVIKNMQIGNKKLTVKCSAAFLN